jgi:hypothetical protein
MSTKAKAKDPQTVLPKQVQRTIAETLSTLRTVTKVAA